MRSNAILHIDNNDKYCFSLSILTYLHTCNNNHPNRVSNYRQYFTELNIDGFDFTNGFKSSDVHRFNELNNLSANIFEINFYEDQNNWRHKLIPIEDSKNISDRFIDWIIYKKHYAMIKKLNVLLGDHYKKIICRRWLNSYTSVKILMLHKPKCENNDIVTIRTSNESRIYWKKTFS